MIISESAKSKSLELTNNDEYIRVSIEGGGCAGFSKKFEITNVVQENDFIFGKFITDSVSYSFLKNSEIKFIKDLMGEHWNIDIPEASSSCGCGTSFSL